MGASHKSSALDNHQTGISNVFTAEDDTKGLNLVRICSEALVQAVAKCMVDA
jgi:hypothetical protein